MSIILARLPPKSWSYGSSLACARNCRLDPSSTHHGAYVDDEGILHYQHVDVAAKTVTTLLRFQLQYRAAEGTPYEPVSKPWSFEFIPGMPGDILLVQEGSCRILYASFPKQGVDSSDVFLFGSHTAPVCCLSTNGNIALSGCQQGVLKMWRLSDGQLADTASLPDSARITALAMLGPLLVAAGSSSSSITLYDIASGRLLAVQRLLTGPGAVGCLAGWLPHQLVAAANLAPGGPLPPDGGGVLAGRATGSHHELESGDAVATRPLLAAASTSGWLCIFEGPAATDPDPAWGLIHSTGSIIASSPASVVQLAFTQDGSSLAVASPVAQFLGTQLVAATAAGGQPGAVSLYQVARGRSSSSSRSALSGLVPPLLLEQQQRAQLQELLLWHQWSLSSVAAGLAVLPGSAFKLLSGKQVQPTQVVQLYVVPEAGPGQVLCAERSLQAQQHRSTHASCSKSPLRQQQPSGAVGAVSSTALAPAVENSNDTQQQQQQALAAGSSNLAQPLSHSSSSSSRSSIKDEEALLVNIAERDLAEVADAIAAAAGPVHDAELAALLAEVTAGLPATAAAAAAAAHLTASRLADEHPAVTADTAATAAAAAAGMSAFGGGAVGHQAGRTGAELGLQAETMAGPAAVGLQEQLQSGPTPATVLAAAGATGPEGTAAAAGTGFRLPQTLPAARSWMDTGIAVAAGLAAPVQAACLDLAALAQELQEEQQRLQQEQQHVQEEEQRLQQQQQQQSLQGLNSAAAAAAHLVAASVTGTTNAQQGAEQELPCKTSFQQVLQERQGSQHRPAVQEGPERPLRQQQLVQQQQQQQDFREAPPQQQWARPAAQGATESTQTIPSSLHAGRHVVSTAAAAPATVASSPGAAVASSRHMMPCSTETEEPEPRQLPALLRQQGLDRSVPAAVAAGGLVPSATAASVRATAVPSGGGSRRIPPAMHVQGRSAAVAAAHVAATQPGGGEHAAAVTATASQSCQVVQQQEQERHQDASLPRQQQQEDGQEQGQRSLQAQSTKLSAQQRLSLRRQQMQLKRQQQQQQGPRQQEASHVTAAAVQGDADSARLASEAAAAAAVRADGSRRSVPNSDHPLAVAVQNSSLLLAAKIQEAEEAPDVAVDPSNPEVLKLAAARLAELDLAPDQQQYNYEELPDVRDVATPTHAPKLVPKQLDPQWVASRRSLKPRMDTLFRPQDWQQGFVDPQVLVLPSWSTPQQVVQQLLWPGQRPGVWT